MPGEKEDNKLPIEHAKDQHIEKKQKKLPTKKTGKTENSYQLKSYSISNLTAGDAVSTLIYATAVNVLLSQIVTLELKSIIAGSFIVSFIFFDWMNRIGVPQTFPEVDQQMRDRPLTMTFKALLEILAIYFFLMSAYNYLATLTFNDDVRLFFGCYLTLSFIWNLLVLWTMTKLDFFPLLWESIAGSTFDTEAAKIYTQGFYSGLERTRDNLKRAQTFLGAIAYLFRLMVIFIARPISQLVGHHVTWANLFFASVIFFMPPNESLLSSFFPQLNFLTKFPWTVELIVLAMMIVPACFYILAGLERKIDKCKRTQKQSILMKFGGLTSTILLLFLYSLFDADILKWVIIFQHVLFAIALQFTIKSPVKEASVSRVAS